MKTDWKHRTKSCSLEKSQMPQFLKSQFYNKHQTCTGIPNLIGGKLTVQKYKTQAYINHHERNLAIHNKQKN